MAAAAGIQFTVVGGFRTWPYIYDDLNVSLSLSLSFSINLFLFDVLFFRCSRGNGGHARYHISVSGMLVCITGPWSCHERHWMALRLLVSRMSTGVNELIYFVAVKLT